MKNAEVTFLKIKLIQWVYHVMKKGFDEAISRETLPSLSY